MPAKRHGPTGDPALKTRERAALRQAVGRTVAMGRGCELPNCKYPGIPIDLLATTGPFRYVLDEIIPRDLGGSPIDPNNVRPGHHSCNAAAGAHITNAKRQAGSQTRTASRW